MSIDTVTVTETINEDRLNSRTNLSVERGYNVRLNYTLDVCDAPTDLSEAREFATEALREVLNGEHGSSVLDSTEFVVPLVGFQVSDGLVIVRASVNVEGSWYDPDWTYEG